LYFVFRILIKGTWLFGSISCTLWIFLDILLCTSSIYHLSAVSILRFIAIQYPLKSRFKFKRTKFTFRVITLIWIISIFISSGIFLIIKNENKNKIQNFNTNLYNNNDNYHQNIGNSSDASNSFITFERPDLVLTSFASSSSSFLKNKTQNVSYVCELRNNHFIFYGSVVSFVIPLICMIFMFLLTVHKLREQLRLIKQSNVNNYPLIDDKKSYNYTTHFSRISTYKKKSEV
jgi:archaellum component FlaF (FlaF/FlaG flagellin family)